MNATTATAVATMPAPSDLSSALGLLLFVAIVIAAWVAACLFWPWTRCSNPRCENGKRMQPGKERRNWRDCPTCKGRGRRVRPGTRFWRSVFGVGKR